MNTLTQEQVDALNYQECQAALKLLHRTYDMTKPMSQLTPAEWANCDEVCNTHLWLEDRIARFEDVRIPSMDPGVVIVKKLEPLPKKKPGKTPRQFRIETTIYADIHQASKKTGIKVQTLKTYVSRKPDRYSYVD
jgi:hypothetical protein